MRRYRVGVLAVQGAFIEHEQAFERAGFDAVEIRQLADLEQHFDVLVFPGGESTVQRLLLHELGLVESLWRMIDSGIPVFATCAGLILLANKVDGERNALGRLDISVKRNAYGRQLGSFSTVGVFCGREHVRMTFIRAPGIECVGSGVEILSRYEGNATGVRQGNIVGLAWHPELNAGETLLADMFLSERGRVC
ncbi:MAG: pyridoxal 5'-phosphate synthase glutaminase subunit PdxT [Proteobacteria bacterium]|nr:pyridoxal 5'-phosphate synthase glutaminase subunit PdxT [Pseudomonadota bacterium]